MKYYEIIEKDSIKYPFILFEIESPPSITDFDVIKGIEFKNWDNQMGLKITFEHKPDAILEDWIPNNKAWPTVTERFKNIIESVNCGKDIQFLPVTAMSNDGKESIKMYLISKFTWVDALNIDNSLIFHTLSQEDPNNLDVVKFALNASKTQDLDFFKLTKSAMSIFISDKLARLIRKNKLKGMELLPVKVIEWLFNKLFFYD